jgi:hypothetical protein
MEQLLVLAMIALAAFISMLVRWARERTTAPAPAPAPPTERRRLPRAVRVRPSEPPAEVPVSVPRRTVSPMSGLLARRRRPVHRRLGSHADVRRAVVAMTVLGPCRALERESGIPAP